MKLEITQRGAFDSDGVELPIGSTVEVEGDTVPSYLVSKAVDTNKRVAVTNPAQDAIVEPVDDDDAEIDALRAEYLDKTGEEADGRWKAGTLRKKLAAL